ncbi:MAG: DUF1592 domain-containing protein [Pseudomonadota bacterium]
MRRRTIAAGQIVARCALALFALTAPSPGFSEPVPVPTPETGTTVDNAAAAHAFLDRYCERCHNEERFAGYWALVDVDAAEIARGANLSAWEKILRQTQDSAMPPPERKKQPSAAERRGFSLWLETQLDSYGAAHPDPGRSTLRRLNRAEYANAVRDLLEVDIGLEDRLPADDSGYGFDNIADVLSVSTTLMDRYFSVAGRASRLALGAGPAIPVLTSFQLPKDGSILNQGIPAYNVRASGELPIDSRGGAAFDYFASHAGDYVISGYLNANTNNEVDRLEENRYAWRVPLEAGSHTVGMSFRRQLALDETVQTLRNTTDIVPLPTSPPRLLTLDFVVDGARVGSTQVPSYHLSPRFAQKNFPRDLLQIDIEGPFPSAESQPVTGTHTRHRQQQTPFTLLDCRPASRAAELACARATLTPLARRAYRRAVTDQDVEPLLAVFLAAREAATFRTAMAAAVQALLVSPSFLFAIEEAPAGTAPGTVHRISDLAFATRLALFLWSSVPDEELLQLAIANRLREPQTLDRQVERMLSDDRARALTENFAGQWLFLRNLDYHRADVEAYPAFDQPLRSAMRAETEQFFAAIIREDRSLLDFIRADHTYLNERLARHYGIEGVYGPAVRRVPLPATARRGGLLGQASLLTLTSYGNQTSVVRRGQWILDALLAAPPPPPPEDVPALVAEQAGRALNAREQLELHRAEPACASCHARMDPLGLALERYDAIGAYRTEDAGRPIDVRTALPDGTSFSGLAGLQQVLLERSDQFARAFVEHLMTYALGRGLEAHDRPAVRAIAAGAARNDYRVRSILLGIIRSYAFNHRRAQAS